MRQLTTFTLTLLLFIWSGCSGVFNNRDKNIREISTPDSTYELATGDSLRIALDQCIGCDGYWEIAFQDSLVSIREEGVRSNENCQGCTGGQGQAMFMIKAQKRGNARVDFVYRGFTESFRFNIK